MVRSRTTIASSKWGAHGLLAVLIVLLPGAAAAVELDFGGDARLYAFLAIDDLPDRRNDSELGILRLKLDTAFTDELSIASCWRSAKFSRANRRCVWNREHNVLSTASN